MPGTPKSHELCNYRLAIHWVGVLSVMAYATGVVLSVLKIEAAIIILVLGVPGTVVAALAGYIGGRIASQQTTNTGPTEHVTITTPATETQPTTEEPA
jgi:hypothetical protein